MNTFNIKTILLPLLFLSFGSFSQDLQHKHKWWIPKGTVIQHGGSIGYLSAGISYQVNKSGSSSLDFHYGNVPKSKGGDLHIITTKFQWKPVSLKLKDNILIYPFNPGIFISYHMGKNFDSKWDDNNYPKGYYWWSTAIRPHISISNEVKYKLNKKKNSGIKAISFYNEFNTNELYFISYIQNIRHTKLSDIFKIGIGSRIHL